MNGCAPRSATTAAKAGARHKMASSRSRADVRTNRRLSLRSPSGSKATRPRARGPRDMVTTVPISCLADWRLPDVKFLAAFRLPGGDERCMELAEQNRLWPREARITFHESTHTYEINGVRAPRSVTGLVHSYAASSFKPWEAVAAMKAGRRWEERRPDFLRSDGGEMSDADVVELWEQNGRVASARGVLFHYHCEAWCNGRVIEQPHSPEFQMFLLLTDAFREMGFVPFRTEVCLFHVGLCVAGQLDALFWNADKKQLALIDWKRCKSVVFDNSFRTLRAPLDHMPECTGSFYALQLNLYRYILESEYGCPVESMFLGVCHPYLQKPRLIRVPPMQEEIELLVEDQISRGLAVSAAEPGPTAVFRLP